MGSDPQRATLQPLPVLAEAFREWLEKRLREVTDGTEPVYERAWLNQVHALELVRRSLWFWQTAKKRYVDDCISAVTRGTVTSRIGD